MDIKKSVKDSVDNVRDGAKEAMHRSTADAEHMRRDVAGDTMASGEKVKSVVNEGKNRVEASVDHAKQEVRKHT